MKHLSFLFLGLGLFVLPTAARASQLYSVEFAGFTDLFNLDQVTGLATSVGATGFDDVGDLTSDTRPASYTVWGTQIGSKSLLEIDPVTGSAVVAAPLDSPTGIVSLAFNSVTGVLYGNTSVGFDATQDDLYIIDPTTGNTTLVGPIGFDNVFALAFDQTGQLFGISNDTNDFISIDTTTGDGTSITVLSQTSIFDLASRPEDNTMFLVTTNGVKLMTIDTSNGALTDVGPYVDASNLVGLAFSPVPEPGSVVLFGLGAMGMFLVARRRNRA